MSDYVNGNFDYVPYNYVLASCVLTFTHSLVVLCYYLLPVDSSDRKYVPGIINMQIRLPRYFYSASTLIHFLSFYHIIYHMDNTLQ